MADDHEYRNAPGYISHTDDPEFMVLDPSCFDMDRRHFCAASAFELATRIAPDGTHAIVVLLGKGGHGYHQLLTCHGAREIGQGLIAMADEIEQRQAEQAKAQLAETLNRRKQP